MNKIQREAVKAYFMRNFIAIGQLANTLIGGSPSVTIVARIKGLFQ